MSSWDARFMMNAELIAAWSKDPRRKVGCVVVDDEHNQLSGGFNGFPRGVKDDERLIDKAVKLKMIVHAEANAVAAAARNGHSLKFSTVYVTHPVCAQCAALLIQAGVKRVVYRECNEPQPEWEADWQWARVMFAEASVLLECI